ncbi:MAG TPA: STAS domain-containing protein [Solirubrobacteraceae bacterium]
MEADERMQVEHLQVEVRSEPDRVVLHLLGELDLASAPLLQGTLENAEADAPPLTVLDLDDLEFIDSTGLRIILAAHERAQERGQMLALTRGSQQVQRLMSITRAGEHLRIIDNADAQLV